MKKQKHSKPEDAPEDKKPVSDAEPEAPAIQNEDEQDLQAQRLSEIESTEVSSDENHEESIDPDKLVTIIPKTQKARLPWWKERKYQVVLAIITLLVVVLAIPPTRYIALGWIWRENVTITVIDGTTGSPVSDASVTIVDQRGMTDSRGKVTLSAIGLGSYTAQIEKPHYKTTSMPVVVDIFSSSQDRKQTFSATGRLQALQVVDRLTGRPIPEATITDGKGVTIARTNKDGRATVVVPINKKELDVSIAAGKYRVLAAKVLTETKTLQLIPDGVLYFLSKQSGKIDVVKSNLDGSDRKVIAEGTGNESDMTTTLLASRDWRYLVLKAKRAPNKPESLFVIDTVNDSMKLLDEGNANFEPIGWSGHHFIYKVARQDGKYWQAKQVALKSYSAQKSAISTIDENASDAESNDTSPFHEIIDGQHILEDRLVYAKVWTGNPQKAAAFEGKQAQIISVRPDGSDKKAVKTFPAATVGSIRARLHLPQEMTFEIGDRSGVMKYTYGELEGEAYKALPAADFSKADPIYLMSPSGNSSFWFEERDGKSVLFIGDKNAGDRKEIASKTEFKSYGWLTDDYLLLQKNDSELYVTTRAQLEAGGEPLKVGDYHRARTEIIGYGYGYGGQ